MYIIPLWGGGQTQSHILQFPGTTTNNMAEMQTKKLIEMSFNNNFVSGTANRKMTKVIALTLTKLLKKTWV
jgi:hypothetical protein